MQAMTVGNARAQSYTQFLGINDQPHIWMRETYSFVFGDGTVFKAESYNCCHT